jgi:hypothetical protein
VSEAEVLETGLTYDGVVPVEVHMRRRERRLEFTDGGGAVAAAGARPKALALPDHIDLGPYSVNVTRQGVVSLPGFTTQSEEWLARLPQMVAEGSVALYEALLDLDR